MEKYSIISKIYDRINSTVDYGKWAKDVETSLEKFGCRPSIVLDLACGTGSMTRALARDGYDMIGVDLSEDMLAIAAKKTDAEKAKCGNFTHDVLYLCQDMTDFELYGTVGAAVCCLDSLNYLTEDGALSRCFSLVHNYLDPDGVFLFDVNTPYKFENIYGRNSYVYELEGSARKPGSFCVWQNFYRKKEKICEFYLTCFEEIRGDRNGGGRYVRSDEYQEERCFTKKEICEALCDTGFELLGIYGSSDLSEVKPTTERWYFAARCKK